MVYICKKDFELNSILIKKGEYVNIKFSHSTDGIKHFFITYQNKEYTVYKSSDVLSYFENLASFRNSKISEILNK